MLRLMLLRHAKSSWADEALTDRQRPLTERGRKAAAAMGLFIARKGPLPQVVLCSPARRARETLDRAARALPPDLEIRIVEDLYNFDDGSVITAVVRGLAAAPSPVLLVGHNPSMEEAALALSAADGSSARTRLAEKFPTAALAVIDFDAPDWAGIQSGQGRLAAFTTPRDIGV